MSSSPIIGLDSEKNSMLPREKKRQPEQTEKKPRNDVLIICRSFESFDALHCYDSSPVMIQISRKPIQI